MDRQQLRHIVPGRLQGIFQHDNLRLKKSLTFHRSINRRFQRLHTRLDRRCSRADQRRRPHLLGADHFSQLLPNRGDRTTSDLGQYLLDVQRLTARQSASDNLADGVSKGVAGTGFWRGGHHRN